MTYQQVLLVFGGAFLLFLSRQISILIRRICCHLLCLLLLGVGPVLLLSQGFLDFVALRIFCQQLQHKAGTATYIVLCLLDRALLVSGNSFCFVISCHQEMCERRRILEVSSFVVRWP